MKYSGINYVAVCTVGVAVITAVLQPPAVSACPNAIPQVVTGSAIRGKVGFVCDTCPKHFYLVQKTGTQFSGYYHDWVWEVDDVQTGAGHWGDVYTDTQVYRNYVESKFLPDVLPDDSPMPDGCGLTAKLVTSSVGNCTHESTEVYENAQYPVGSKSDYEDLGNGFWEWKRYSLDNQGNWVLQYTSPTESNPWSVWWELVFIDGQYVSLWNPVETHCGRQVSIIDYAYTTDDGDGDGVFDQGEREGWVDTRNGKTGTWLESEYTTELLQQTVEGLAVSRVPSFPSEPPVLGTDPQAITSIVADESCASASACKWRAWLTGLVKDHKYRLFYTKVEIILANGTRTENRSEVSSEIFTASAESQWYTPPDSYIPPPSWVLGSCGDGSPGEHSVSLTGFFVIEEEDPDGPPGTGGPGGCGNGGGDKDSGSGCSSCSEAISEADFPGVCFNVTMGTADGGGSAGEFNFSAPSLIPDTAKRATLEFSGQHGQGGVEVYRVTSGGQLLQVISPQAIANVNVISDYAYEIKVYLPAAKGDWDAGEERYAIVNGAANLITTWTIENPDEGTAYNRLQITEQLSAGDDPRIWLYSYTDATKTWSLALPGQQTEQRTTQTLSVDANGLPTRTLVTQMAVPSGAVAQERTRVYKRYSWGEGLTTDTMGSGGDARVTQYTYFTDGDIPYPASSSLPPIKEILQPDGAWTRYTLANGTAAYDSYGRPLRMLTGIDAAPTDNTSLCRSTEYSYTPVDVNDDGSREPRSARKVVEAFKGTVVSLTYHVYLATSTELETRELRCTNPSATYAQAVSDPTTQVSVMVRDATTGRSLRDKHADGTMTFYGYSPDFLIETVSSGEPNPGATAILNGTQTITESGNQGELLSTTSKNIRGGTVGVTLSIESYSQFDSYRPGKVTYLDGSYMEKFYACCGLDSETDRDGTLTEFRYDALKRQTATIRNGITTTNILDAAGRISMVRRIGTDGSPITLRGYAYNTAGETIRETNALNGVTTFVEGLNGGFRIRTITAPDEGVRVETYYRDGSRKSVEGNGALPVFYEHGTDVAGYYVKETKGSGTGNEWTKSYSDLLGRQFKTVYSPRAGVDNPNDPPYNRAFYNNKGQLWKQRDPDDVITLFRYNAQSEQAYTIQALTSTARDLNSYADLENPTTWNNLLGGVDRIWRTTNSVLAFSDVGNGRGVDIRRSERYVWKDGSSTPTLVSSSDTATTGNQSWSCIRADATTTATTTATTMFDRPNHKRTVTVAGPYGGQTVTVYLNGRPDSVTRQDNTVSHNQITKTTYGYDKFGQQNTVTDARNGTMTYTFNNADQVTSMTTPAPGTGQLPQTTITHYNKSLQATNIIQPDGASLTNEYYFTGLLKRSYGSRTYPVAYSYDYAGRMKTMTNWSAFAVTGAGIGARVTTWNYNPYRGWLDCKDYADASTGDPGTTGPDYAYTPGARLKTRTWGRTGTGGQRIVTTYKYGFDDALTDNQHGELTEVSYANDPQSTPAVTFANDRLGRQKKIVRGSMTTTRTYNDAGQLLSESHTGGTLAGLSVTSDYDDYLRRETLTALNGSTPLTHASYSYDNASRLWTVTEDIGSPTHSSAYTYLENSMLAGTVNFKQGATAQMTTTRRFDYLNRLSAIVSMPTGSGQSPISYTYQYNSANQRVHVALADGSFWMYDYDKLGQVKSGKKYWSDWTPVAGQQFEYGFDDIGNRTGVKGGGDDAGAGLRSVSYAANKLNQYSSRTVPGAVDVMGVALAGSAVTVNSQSPYRRGEYFRKELTVANSSAPVWQQVDVTATGETSATRHEFVPQTPENYDDPATPLVNESHDADGNQLRDGRWSYTWDAENRLVQIESLASGPTASKRKVVWEYDGQSRRIRQTTYDGSSGSYQLTEDLKFLSDGWRHIAEVNAANNVLVRSYVWGLDLSGSLDGAGGVGGLLMVKSAANGTHFCSYDGNGNVAALVKATDGNASANYDYGPFGEAIRATGTMAKENPFRFSTKRTDNRTDLVLYEYRFYGPSIGRWLSRGSVEEEEGYNFYGLGYSGPATTPPSSSPGNVPKIDCSGYTGLGGKRCRTCYGLGSRKDPYPEKAHKVCEGFAELYTGTGMQAAAACVAQCLIAAEREAGKKPLCSARNCFRIEAHFFCYSMCLFWPTEGFPDGGWGVGIFDLAPSCASGGAF